MVEHLCNGSSNNSPVVMSEMYLDGRASAHGAMGHQIIAQWCRVRCISMVEHLCNGSSNNSPVVPSEMYLHGRASVQWVIK